MPGGSRCCCARRPSCSATLSRGRDALSRRPAIGPDAAGRSAVRSRPRCSSWRSPGSILATHGDPLAYPEPAVARIQPSATGRRSGSHFATVGSGRYDVWRVSLDALTAHPIGGPRAGQLRRLLHHPPPDHEEPSWTHSLEMRLLAHTGLVGFALFAAFLIAALSLRVGRPAPGCRRWLQQPLGRRRSPLLVWLIHGSVDWFWELPALSGPALGFLAVAMAPCDGPASTRGRSGLRSRCRGVPAWLHPRRRTRAPVAVRPAAPPCVAVLVAVLGFPYLSVREVSLASDLPHARPRRRADRPRPGRLAQPAERGAGPPRRDDRLGRRPLRRSRDPLPPGDRPRTRRLVRLVRGGARRLGSRRRRNRAPRVSRVAGSINSQSERSGRRWPGSTRSTRSPRPRDCLCCCLTVRWGVILDDLG